LLQRVSIDSASGYSIEMNLLILAIGANAVNYSEFTHITAASRTIIARRAEKKFVPAVFTESVVGFADALPAIYADRRPKEVI
jgi:hypothetical protein